MRRDILTARAEKEMREEIMMLNSEDVRKMKEENEKILERWAEDYLEVKEALEKETDERKHEIVEELRKQERESGEQLEDDKDGEEEAERVKPKTRNKPDIPSAKEVEEHYSANHVPFRNWCNACVMGKCVNNPHYRQHKTEEDRVSTVSIDYAFMHSGLETEEYEEDLTPIIVMVDRNTKKIFANVVPNKGVNPYAVKTVVQNLETLGYKKLNLKCDQEPAIIALRNAVKAESTIDIVPEEVPVGESQANGEVEQAINRVKAQVRTMRLSLQEHIGSDILVTWL